MRSGLKTSPRRLPRCWQRPSPFQSPIGAVRYPGIKIHDPRVIRLLEVLLHGGSQVGGWTAKQIHHAVFTTFHLSDSTYGLNQLR